jgi:hypothetical protein
MIAHERWLELREQISFAFDTASRPGFWIQKRMVADFKRLNAIYEAQKKGGEQTRFRQQLPRSPEGDQQATSSLPREEVDLEVEVDKEKTKPTPMGSRSRARRSEGLPSLKDPDRPAPPGVEPDTWAAWFSHRVSIKKPLNELSSRMCFNELSRFYEDGHDPDQIIQTAIASGWRGLFVPREELNGRNGNGSKGR